MAGRPFIPVAIPGHDGPVDGRLYPCDAAAGVLWLGGSGGGWDSPARGLFPRLADLLRVDGLVSLRVRYRRPTDLVACTADAVAALEWLARRGADRCGVVGHSLGGAVAIRAAAVVDRVRAVVALAPQADGADAVATLGPRCATLVIHGGADAVLPVRCGERLYRMAREPRRFVVHADADHGLDDVVDDVAADVRSWLVGWLAGTREWLGRPDPVSDF